MRRLAALNAMLMCAAASGFAQQLDVHFSCSSPGDDHGDKVIYADSGEITDGKTIMLLQFLALHP